MTAGSSDTAESSSRESQRLRMRVKTKDHWKESLTTAREAAAVTMSHTVEEMKQNLAGFQ